VPVKARNIALGTPATMLPRTAGNAYLAP